MNDNEVSSAYRSPHINTSRNLMAYATYPLPEDYADYPDHFAIARYFDDYVDHFGFRSRIDFRTEVVRVVAAEGGGYDVTTHAVESGEERTAHHRAVMVANGHHWDPRWPEPPFPGAEGFAGEQMHSHHYKTPDVLVDRRASSFSASATRRRTSRWRARATQPRPSWPCAAAPGSCPSTCSAARPDETNTPGLTRMPLPVQRWVLATSLRVSQGRMRDFGLPDPDHKLLEAHPTLSSDLLVRVGHGDVVVKPNIERFAGDRRVRFVDGSEEEIDLVVYCTGYKISFPFFDEGFVAAPDNNVRLYRRVVDPDHPGLYFIGLTQPLGAIMPIAEAQSEWVADILTGRVRLPSTHAMKAVIDREDRRMASRYVASNRHTIQVDFHPYLRTIARERRAGARRRRPVLGTLARRSHELRVGSLSA